MRLELGASVLLERRGEEIVDTGLYHLPDAAGVSLCGLPGEEYVYKGSLRDLRMCGVCRSRAPELVEALPGNAVELEPRRRGGRSRFTEAQVRAFHLAYTRGTPLLALARQTYERLSYDSPEALRFALYHEFRVRGLPTSRYHRAEEQEREAA